MNLHQLQYLCEIARCQLNISRAAKALGTSQPAVSQQVRLLEDELGVVIFRRSRNRLTALTPEGETVLESAKHVLAEVANVQSIARRGERTEGAPLRIASSHAQARYTLPGVIRRFAKSYQGIDVHITQPHDDEGALWPMVQNGDVDLAITTGLGGLPSSLVALECAPVRRSLIAPKGHPLLSRRTLTLDAIAHYPLVTYPEHSNGRRRLIRAFAALGCTPRVVVSALDEDIVKACVAEGLGIAILASLVYDPKRDARLGARDVTGLLEPSVTGLIVRRSMLRHRHIATFIELFAPKWTRQRLGRLAGATCEPTAGNG